MPAAKSKANEVRSPRTSANLDLGFGLVNVPIAICPLVSERRGVSGRMVCPTHMEPIQMRSLCGEGEKHEHTLGRGETAIGYEVPGEDRYVLLDDAILDELLEQRTGRVEIERFVPTDQVDANHVERTYLCWPRENAGHGFDVLVEAMRREGKAAVATAVMTKQTRLLVLRWSDVTGSLVVDLCYFDSQIRWGDVELVHEGRKVRPDVTGEELEMAATLIGSLAGEFEPEDVEDGYTPALQEAIQIAAGSQKPKRKAKKVEPKPAGDIMAALKASVVEAQARKKEREELPA